MPGYVEKALQRFEIDAPKRAQHSPHNHIEPNYGSKQQFVPEPDNSPALEQKQITRLQQIIGTFLFYDRAVDSTMLPALETLAQAQTRGTMDSNNGSGYTTTQLCRHPPQRTSHLPCKQHDPTHPQQCFLPQRRKSAFTSPRILFSQWQRRSLRKS
jgi:hypothetical protein